MSDYKTNLNLTRFTTKIKLGGKKHVSFQESTNIVVKFNF